jgi:YesN/AraC family two-component response regulator
MKPDIVITDIKMKKMNGDELTEYIYHNHPEIRTIILSSYSDYYYVRTTLKNNAVDYIIKHDLNEQVLLECLNKSKELILNGPEIVKSQVNMHELRRKFITSLVAGMYEDDKETILHYITNLGINLDVEKNCVAIIMTINHYKKLYASKELKEKLVQQNAICNVVQEIIEESYKGICCHMEEERYIIILAIGNNPSWYQVVDTIYEFINITTFCVKKFLNLEVRFSVGPSHPIHLLHKSYDIALKQFSDNFYKGKDWIIYNGEYKRNNSKKEENYEKLSLNEEKELNILLEKLEIEELHSMLRAIFLRLKEKKASKDQCLILFHELVVFIIKHCKRHKIKIEEVFLEDYSLDDLVMRLDVSLNEIELYFIEIFDKLFTYLNHDSNGKRYSKHIESALYIIQSRYNKPISLNSIADELDLNASYLSWLFKTEVTIGFADYLNDFRLEKAKNYLDEGVYDIKEIVNMCGFGGYTYFFSLFKKKYKVTPKKYIKENLT